jgi:hypothetical protein
VTPITKAVAKTVYETVYDGGAFRQAARKAMMGVRMDRMTKATLWVAFLVLFSYFTWFYVDCAMDESCHIVCTTGGRGGCHTERKPDLTLH